MRVEADGPSPCNWAVVGEGPGQEECDRGRGFVGPSGKLLWPLVRTYGRLGRHECYVTNLSKERLDDDLPPEEKLPPARFAACQAELVAELYTVRPRRVLAVGALAARALMGEAFTTMDACSGMEWKSPDGWTVVPGFHPAAALRGAGEGKNPLAYLATAIKVWRHGTTYSPTYNPSWLAIDTEGYPTEPLMLTWARRVGKLESGVVYPADVPAWWAANAPGSTILWHNAMWDWGVVEAMGVPEPWQVPYEDTMERAYIRTCDPQGLKELTWKHRGERMRTYEQVVVPHWERAVRKAAAERMAKGTWLLENWWTPKGKRRKMPKEITVYSPTAGKLRRLKDPERLAGVLGMEGASLKFVPRLEAEAYAIQDAVSTLLLREIL